MLFNEYIIDLYMTLKIYFVSLFARINIKDVLFMCLIEASIKYCQFQQIMKIVHLLIIMSFFCV